MKIAVVGGGITGSVVASELARVLGNSRGDDHEESDEVVLFDQGRRGPGGRASHRSVVSKKTKNPESGEDEKEEFVVLPDDDIDESAFQFDHGCQFFRADCPPMKDLVEKWLQKRWVSPWKARFGSLPETNDGDGDGGETNDFFGVPSTNNNSETDGDFNDVYIGVGGMHLLPRRILDASGAIVHRGTRVSGVVRREVGDARDGNNEVQRTHVWDVTTVVGTAAFHDTQESEATAELETAKTEIASGNENQNVSGSAGAPRPTTRVVIHRIPTGFASRLPPKLRMPLFSCMITLKTPLGNRLPFDAFTAKSSSRSPLWFAARSDSKPGFPVVGGGCECWTLVSTPSFAVDEIRDTTMRDPVTGAFRPQENDYLNTVPGPALKEAFFEFVRPYLEEDAQALLDQPLVYLQAQRWGSGLPVDPEMVAPENVEEICGTTYASKPKGSLVYATSVEEIQNFVADDDERLYYGGDFCSKINPGFEAAALSGFDLAHHILRSFK